ncbi:uncharacterized protein DCS_04226 [Drechmeria coniospora]|uniref:Uncharacterized protein n=1 Tax=Drechmeria coniospora TaxID=98403 RepID=A0A151GJF6_DRECN|nr:uncharacterized protein DCS_04226 [Drechmeria coniospora]KYK57219.1 uncharacterized protein DCS_04226 [Drechmeria coniospora]
MGDPDADTPSHAGESTAAISLYPTAAPPADGMRYMDDPTLALDGIDDDLPPLYTDHEEFVDGESSRGPVDPLMPRGGAELVRPFGQDADGTTTYYVDARLDSDPKFLLDHITRLAALPPRPFVRLRGTHRERRREQGKDRPASARVVDFDVRVELTHLLYTDIGRQQSWRSLVTASNFEKVRRGTVRAQRAPEEGVPGVEQWCHRFCASAAGLRCFTLERRVDGWDWDLLRRRLEALVRATNYRGRCEVTFPVANARVDVYNACLANRWRLTRWICFLFYASLLFLFTWPWLHFATKRWETVTAAWPMSRPTAVPGRRRYAAGVSEEAWYGMWAKAIQRAMLERRDAELDQRDLEASRGQPAGGDGALGDVLRAGVEAMGVVNRSFGWGGDQ